MEPKYHLEQRIETYELGPCVVVSIYRLYVTHNMNADTFAYVLRDEAGSDFTFTEKSITIT